MDRRPQRRTQFAAERCESRADLGRAVDTDDVEGAVFALVYAEQDDPAVALFANALTDCHRVLGSSLRAPYLSGWRETPGSRRVSPCRA